LAALDNLYRLLRTRPEPSSLGPEDIQVVTAAYEAAVSNLKVRPEDTTTRATLASHIIEGALLGERDPIRLRNHALAKFRTR
jgi:hypothetical protein